MDGKIKRMNLSVLSLSLPIFAEVFLQMLIGNVDQFMMSRYSQEAVAAVANANQIMNIIIMLLVVMSTATTILIAQYLGAQNRDKINEVCTVSVAFNALFGAVAASIIILARHRLFSWLGVPAEIIDDTALYMSIVACTIPITGAYMTFVATFRGHSLPAVTMCIAFVMNIIHIASNWVFIFGWGPIPSMGVFGVSVSTFMSKGLGLLLIIGVMYYLLPVRLYWKYVWPLRWQTLKGILNISLPSGGETLSYQLSQTTIMRMINVLGLLVIDTKVYVYILAMFCYMYTIALANAAQIVVGFLIGADRDGEVSAKVWQTMFLGMAISVAITIGMYMYSNQILSIFTTDPEVLALGHQVLLVEILLEIGRSVNIVMVQCLQAAGDIRTPMIVGIFGMWCCAVPLSYLFGIAWGWGLVGIWLAMAADECLRGLIFIWRWLSGRWRGRKLIAAT